MKTKKFIKTIEVIVLPIAFFTGLALIPALSQKGGFDNNTLLIVILSIYVASYLFFISMWSVTVFGDNDYWKSKDELEKERENYKEAVISYNNAKNSLAKKVIELSN